MLKNEKPGKGKWQDKKFAAPEKFKEGNKTGQRCFASWPHWGSSKKAQNSTSLGDVRRLTCLHSFDTQVVPQKYTKCANILFVTSFFSLEIILP